MLPGLNPIFFNSLNFSIVLSSVSILIDAAKLDPDPFRILEMFFGMNPQLNRKIFSLFIVSSEDNIPKDVVNIFLLLPPRMLEIFCGVKSIEPIIIKTFTKLWIFLRTNSGFLSIAAEQIEATKVLLMTVGLTTSNSSATLISRTKSSTVCFLLPSCDC